MLSFVRFKYFRGLLLLLLLLLVLLLLLLLSPSLCALFDKIYYCKELNTYRHCEFSWL